MNDVEKALSKHIDKHYYESGILCKRLIDFNGMSTRLESFYT